MKSKRANAYIGVGLLIGVVLGLLLDAISYGVALGFLAGAAYMLMRAKGSG